MKKDDIGFFDRPEIIKILKLISYVMLVAVVVPSFFIKGHGHFAFENIPGFWPVFGFVACIMIVVVSKTIGKVWLQRKENYYD